MQKGKQRVKILESTLLGVVIGGLNLLLPDNPGLFEQFYLPYIACAIIFSLYYGKLYGYLNLLTSIGFLLGIFPFLRDLLYHHPPGDFWAELLPTMVMPMAAAVIITYLTGSIHSNFQKNIDRLTARLKEATKQNWRFKNKTKALSLVNLELEERVSGQQDSMTSLYNQVHKLHSLNVENGLEVLLETVQIFTKSHKVSLWRYNPAENKMNLSGTIGHDEEETGITSLPMEDTIEGWVFRNNSIFSIRMILQYDNLAKMDKGRNLITLPINIEKKVWGVLNVEEMPFEKYNLYSERLLQIIISLAEPALEKALGYESLIQSDEMDPITGLPLFSQLYKVLGDEIKRMTIQKSTLSTIILEIINYPELIENSSQNKVKEMIRDVISELERLTDGKAQFFHYRSENQIAMIYPNIDFDGTSLLCLETLEMVSSGEWLVEGKEVALEVVIGYAAYAGEEKSLDDLLKQAENLLEMQKV
jgi:polysaccharide biosynthesis protein PelD